MKVGIIGPEPMALTWEQHLRFITGVQEVVMARDMGLLDNVDACLILNDASSEKSDSGQLLAALRRGFHVLWVAPLPTDPEEIRKWFEAAEESGVTVMFSMWSHYSPATQWLFNHITPPGKIHIHREWSGPQHTPDIASLYRIFLEEVSLCLEWSRSRLVRFEGDVHIPSLPGTDKPSMQQIFLRFSNGTTSSLFLNPYGLENRHSRFLTGNKMAAVCQVNEHLIKKWMLDGAQQDTPEIMRFDFKEPARHLLSHFIRSVRTGCKPIFGINELHQLADIIEHFRTR
jgi:predicted dehydrogenase